MSKKNNKGTRKAHKLHDVRREKQLQDKHAKAAQVRRQYSALKLVNDDEKRGANAVAKDKKALKEAKKLAGKKAKKGAKTGSSKEDAAGEEAAAAAAEQQAEKNILADLNTALFAMDDFATADFAKNPIEMKSLDIDGDGDDGMGGSANPNASRNPIPVKKSGEKKREGYKYKDARILKVKDDCTMNDGDFMNSHLPQKERHRRQIKHVRDQKIHNDRMKREKEGGKRTVVHVRLTKEERKQKSVDKKVRTAALKKRKGVK